MIIIPRECGAGYSDADFLVERPQDGLAKGTHSIFKNSVDLNLMTVTLTAIVLEMLYKFAFWFTKIAEISKNICTAPSIAHWEI